MRKEKAHHYKKKNQWNTKEDIMRGKEGQKSYKMENN